MSIEIISALKDQLSYQDDCGCHRCELVREVESLTTTNQALTAEVERTRDELDVACRLVKIFRDRDEKHKALFVEIYKAGWCSCASWAERDDLITDCDSSAFNAEMQNDIRRIFNKPQPLHAEEVKP
jgi:hypothetical protein